MKYVTLEELKAQMRVDFDDEDSLITLYGNAAEDAVVRFTRRKDAELLKMGYEEQEGEYPTMEPGAEYFPARLKVAVLLTAANFYRNREPVASVSQNLVPYTLEALIKPYRKLSKG